MTSFARQRFFGIVALVIASALAVAIHLRFSATLPHFAYLSGWALFALMILLTIYNARKKLPFLPLLSSRAWLQFHIYAGIFTGVLFAIHVSYRVPSGWFEGALAWLFAIVMLSGIVGLMISRSIPKRLTTRGGEVLFERIPAIRLNLRQQAEALALKSVPDAKSSTVADFYARELHDFFDGTRHVTLHWFEIRRPLNQLLNKISDLNRYLNDKERATLDQLAALVRQKDGLDYHYALQLLLKLWLFVHIPLTYSLLLFTLAHIVLVFAFSGGAQ